MKLEVTVPRSIPNTCGTTKVTGVNWSELSQAQREAHRVNTEQNLRHI